jgi:ketosteroid isomerase-like protein
MSGLEHQVAEGPPGKPTFDGRGKILLVLHKNAQGQWKIQQEMWNSAAKP